MDRSKEHAKKLSEVGLDFTNLVGKDLESKNSVTDGGNTLASAVGLGVARA